MGDEERVGGRVMKPDGRSDPVLNQKVLAKLSARILTI